MQDVISHREIVSSIADRALASSDLATKDSSAVVMMDYERVKKLAEASVEEAKTHVEKHEQFSTIYQRCLDWLPTAKQRLHGIVTGPVKSLEQRVSDVQVSIDVCRSHCFDNGVHWTHSSTQRCNGFYQVLLM